MTNDDWKLFKRICEDAEVVDIDFGEWDKQIGLLMVADHVRGPGGQAAVFLIEFHGVRSLDLQFDHHAVQLGPTEHVQWRVDELIASVESATGHRRITLSGLQATPVLNMEFEALTLHELDQAALDRHCAGWRRPSRAFARPMLLRVLKG